MGVSDDETASAIELDLCFAFNISPNLVKSFEFRGDDLAISFLLSSLLDVEEGESKLIAAAVSILS